MAEILTKMQDGKSIPLNTEEIAEFEQRRVIHEALQIELANTKYQRDRANSYPSTGEQLDMLYHAIDKGELDKTSEFYTTLKAVKDANPKPI